VQTGFEYSDLPFDSLGKHGEYSADILVPVDRFRVPGSGPI
jgi:hypothetical protein